MTGKAKYTVHKGEKVIGATPKEFTRVKVMLRQEVFRNSGAGTAWTTNKSADAIVVHGVELNGEIEEVIAKALEEWYARRVATGR